MEQCFFFLLLGTLLFLSLESGALLLAATTTEQERNGRFPRTAAEPDDLQTPEPPRNTNCPAYVAGVNPKNINRSACKTGSRLGNVGHERAFGFAGSDADLRYCHLPEYPQTNRRVCYRTTLDLCGTNYSLYLNRRSFNSLQRHCTNETENLAILNNQVIFHSPRYKCKKKKNGRLYQYRNKELCLYNVSIPNCQTGVVIETPELTEYQLEERGEENNDCSDYLQFYYHGPDNSLQRTDKICGRGHLSERLNSSNFLAIFWTDTTVNSGGFSVRAMCTDEEHTAGSGVNNVEK